MTTENSPSTRFEQVECTCTHLTDFALVSPDYNQVPARELLELSPTNVREHPEGLITIGTVICMFAFVLVTSIRTDVHEKRRHDLKAAKYSKWDRSLQAQRIHSCANFWKQYKTGLQVHHTWASLLWRKSGPSLVACLGCLIGCGFQTQTTAAAARRF